MRFFSVPTLREKIELNQRDLINTHYVKKATELPCLGILKHGNYDLTIRWMYVLSIDTPTSVRARPERHALAVARTNRLVLAKWGKERACAVPATTIPRCFRV